jgi:hypothetical protein
VNYHRQCRVGCASGIKRLSIHSIHSFIQPYKLISLYLQFLKVSLIETISESTGILSDIIEYHIIPFIPAVDPWYRQEVINELNYKFKENPDYKRFDLELEQARNPNHQESIQHEFFFERIHFINDDIEVGDFERELFQYISPIHPPNYSIKTTSKPVRTLQDRCHCKGY